MMTHMAPELAICLMLSGKAHTVQLALRKPMVNPTRMPMSASWMAFRFARCGTRVFGSEEDGEVIVSMVVMVPVLESLLSVSLMRAMRTIKLEANRLAHHPAMSALRSVLRSVSVSIAP